MNMGINRSTTRGERGLTLPLVALMIVVLFMLAALAIDVGVAFTARTRAQHAADAAALAGAYMWSKRSDLTGAELVDAAFRDGSALGNTYNVLGHQVQINTSASSYESCLTAVNIICVDEAKRRVTAVVQVPVQTYFGRFFTDLLNVRAVANAEAAPSATGDACIKPIFISNDAISTLPLTPTGPGGKATDEDYKNKCQQAYDNNQVIFKRDGDGKWQLTDQALGYIAQQKNFVSNISDPTACFGSAGCPLPILTKEGSPNPSQVGIVDFSEGEGNGAYDGALVACTMGGCLQECPSAKPMFKCSDSDIGLKTGITGGQLDDLLPVIDYAKDTYNGAADYSNGTDTSRSIVSVVVWDCRQTLSNGTQSSATIAGIAKIFMNKMDVSGAKNTNVNAFLVSAGPCGSASGPATGGGPVPVRLVNVNE
ncbi:MAG TPA: pilus assembly protein TadG-related protein [Terriglobales bacterium]|nr:pilus assembly protein TadG-related protein [Terriglobales bacterium]